MLASAFRSWRMQPWQILSTLLVLSGVFGVCLSFLVVQKNMNSVLASWGSEFKVNVYLADSATSEQVESVKSQIESQKIFKGSQFLSKEAALKRFRTRLGFLGSDLVDSGELENPLPASFEATLNTSVGGFIDKLHVFSKELGSQSYVEDVSYGQSWVENYSSAVRAFNYIALAIAALLFAGALLLSASVIRTSILHRREEIELQELFGATRWMIAKPFILEAVALGVLAAATAQIFVFGIYRIFLSTAGEQLQAWNLHMIINFPGFFILAGFSILCILIVGLGSYISVKQINTGWAAAEK